MITKKENSELFRYPYMWNEENKSWNKHLIEIQTANNESSASISYAKRKIYFDKLEDAEEEIGAISDLSIYKFIEAYNFRVRV